MKIQDLVTQPFNRHGFTTYINGDDFLGATMHIYFQDGKPNDTFHEYDNHLDNEDEALLLIDLLRTAIKVAYEVDPTDPVGALEGLLDLHRDLPDDITDDRPWLKRPPTERLHDALQAIVPHRPPSPLPMLPADAIIVEREKPLWLREILECPTISEADKQVCISEWEKLEAGEYPLVDYKPHESIMSAFGWGQTGPMCSFWVGIYAEISRKKNDPRTAM